MRGSVAGIVLGAVMALVAAVLPGVAGAQERLALIIANSDYPGGIVRPLNNPLNDARVMREALIKAGFNVTVEPNRGKEQMERATADFAAALRQAGPDTIGFFYYSGHGASADTGGRRRNYLLPAGTTISGSEQLPLLGVELERIIDSLAAARVKAVFVVSDACRNTLDIGANKGGSDEDRSFVPVPQRSGLYIAFATSAGETAPDDGVYATVLAKHITQSGITTDQVFTRTNRAVAERRRIERIPEVRDGLPRSMDDFCFIGCTQRGPAVASPPQPTPPAPPEPADVRGGHAFEVLPRNRREWERSFMLPIRSGTYNVIVGSYFNDLIRARSSLHEFCARYAGVSFVLWDTVAADGTGNRQLAIVAGFGLSSSLALRVQQNLTGLGFPTRRPNAPYITLQNWDVEQSARDERCS